MGGRDIPQIQGTFMHGVQDVLPEMDLENNELHALGDARRHLLFWMVI